MSIFGFSASQKHNVFTLDSVERPINPKEFGYWSFMWSIDLANQLKGEICKLTPDTSDPSAVSLVSLMYQSSQWAHAELAAVYSGIYQAYAIAVLNVKPELFVQIWPGIKDGIGTIQFEKGVPLTPQNQKYFEQQVGKYMKSAIDDHYAQRLGEKATHTSSHFLNSVEPVYRKLFNVVAPFSLIEMAVTIPDIVQDEVADRFLALKAQRMNYLP